MQQLSTHFLLSYSDHAIIERYKFAINNKQARLFKSRLYEELPVNLPDTSTWYLLSHCFTEC